MNHLDEEELFFSALTKHEYWLSQDKNSNQHDKDSTKHVICIKKISGK